MAGAGFTWPRRELLPRARYPVTAAIRQLVLPALLTIVLPWLGGASVEFGIERILWTFTICSISLNVAIDLVVGFALLLWCAVPSVPYLLCSLNLPGRRTARRPSGLRGFPPQPLAFDDPGGSRLAVLRC